MDATKKARDLGTPEFLLFGLEGSITALLVIDDPFASDEAEDEILVLVGTTKGTVYMYDMLAKKSLGVVYRIPSRGVNPLTKQERAEDEYMMDDEDMQIYKQGGVLQMGSLSTTSLWIQFRGGMLGLYSWDLQTNITPKYRLILEKRFCLMHVGFCRGLYDAPHERFIMPDKEAGGSTGFCMIDDHENKTIYDLSPEVLRTDCKRPADVEKHKPFAGSVSFLQPYHWDDANHYFIGFEDASLMLYNVHQESVIEWFQRSSASQEPENPPALLAIDSRPLLTTDKLEARQFIVAEPAFVYSLYYDPVNQSFHLTNVLKKLKNDQRCTAVSFGPECTKHKVLPRNEPVRLAIGYSYGVFEIYSVVYEFEANNFVFTPIYVSNIFSQIEECQNETINCFGWTRRRNILFAGNDEGRVAHFDRVSLNKQRKPRY